MFRCSCSPERYIQNVNLLYCQKQNCSAKQCGGKPPGVGWHDTYRRVTALALDDLAEREGAIAVERRRRTRTDGERKRRRDGAGTRRAMWRRVQEIPGRLSRGRRRLFRNIFHHLTHGKIVWNKREDNEDVRCASSLWNPICVKHSCASLRVRAKGCVFPPCVCLHRGWRGFFFFPALLCRSLFQRGSGIHFSWALIFSERAYILWARKPTLLHFERVRVSV